MLCLSPEWICLLSGEFWDSKDHLHNAVIVSNRFLGDGKKISALVSADIPCSLRYDFCAQQNFFVTEPNLFKIGDKTVMSVLFDIYFLDDDNVRISGPYSTFLAMAK